jgi:hypothetical protein
MLPEPTPFEPNPFYLRQKTHDQPKRPVRRAGRKTTANPAKKTPAKAASKSTTPPDTRPSDTRQPDTNAPASRRGPPLVFDEEKRILFYQLIRHGFTKGKAARLLGVAPRTVQEAAQNDLEFAEWIQEANLELHAHSAANIARAGRHNWRAAAWLLERATLRRGPGRPRTRSILLTDPLFRRHLKQLIREVLFEVLPELPQDLAGQRAGTDASHSSASPTLSDRLSRASAQTKARHFNSEVPDSPAQLPLHQSLAPPHANGHARITAQNP